MSDLPTIAFMEYLINIAPWLIIVLILGVILFLLWFKSNGFIELRAWISGRPLLEVRRKDGRTDLVLGKYGSGMIESKYGTFIADDLSNFGKSGAKIGWALDTVGITLQPKMLKLIKGLREQHGFTNATDLIEGIKNWHKCSCGFEGIPKPIYKKVEKKEGDITEEGFIFSGFECPNGKEDKGHKLTKSYPEVTSIPFETLSTKKYELYNKHDNNPARQSLMITRKVGINMSEERRFNMKWFSLFLGIGLLFLCIFIGISYLQSNSLMAEPDKLLNICQSMIHVPECLCP